MTRYWVPLRTSPFSEEFWISPLNTVDKRDSDERRVILDLSVSSKRWDTKELLFGFSRQLDFPEGRRFSSSSKRKW